MKMLNMNALAEKRCNEDVRKDLFVLCMREGG